MEISEDQLFLEFATRVKYVLKHFLNEDPDKFDAWTNKLNEEQQHFLTHMDELNAAALCLGKRDRDFINADPSLLERYSNYVKQSISAI